MSSARTDFNDRIHRIYSASSTFQRGLYHLFMLMKRPGVDLYERGVRLYQSIFHLCVALYLLDFRSDLNKKSQRLPAPLRALCTDPTLPTRVEIDPSCLITHSVFEKPEWAGFPIDHELYTSGATALDLYGRTVDLRHNLLYRPMMVVDRGSIEPSKEDKYCWSDCDLRKMLIQAIAPLEIEKAYKQFMKAMRLMGTREPKGSGDLPAAWNFFNCLLQCIDYDSAVNPMEPLIAAYARLLFNGEKAAADKVVEEVLDYRDEILDIEQLAEDLGSDSIRVIARIRQLKK